MLKVLLKGSRDDAASYRCISLQYVESLQDVSAALCVSGQCSCGFLCNNLLKKFEDIENEADV